MACYDLTTRVLFRVEVGIFLFVTRVSRLVLGPTEPSGNAGVKNALIVTFTPHLRHGVASATWTDLLFITTVQTLLWDLRCWKNPVKFKN